LTASIGDLWAQFDNARFSGCDSMVQVLDAIVTLRKAAVRR